MAIKKTVEEDNNILDLIWGIKLPETLFEDRTEEKNLNLIDEIKQATMIHIPSEERERYVPQHLKTHARDNVVQEITDEHGVIFQRSTAQNLTFEQAKYIQTLIKNHAKVELTEEEKRFSMRIALKHLWNIEFDNCVYNALKTETIMKVVEDLMNKEETFPEV